MKIICIISLFLGIVQEIYSQDTIVHQNGNVFLVDIIDKEGEFVSYKLWEVPESRTFRLEKFVIFSLKEENKEEEILYEFNPDIGNIYLVDEMRIFIKGEQDAQKFYTSPIATIAGVLGGAVGGYLLGQGNLIGIAAPVVVPALIFIPPVKIRSNAVRDEKYLNLIPYEQGYKRVAKKKKYLKSLAACAISMAGATVISAVFIDD